MTRLAKTLPPPIRALCHLRASDATPKKAAALFFRPGRSVVPRCRDRCPDYGADAIECFQDAEHKAASPFVPGCPCDQAEPVRLDAGECLEVGGRGPLPALLSALV